MRQKRLAALALALLIGACTQENPGGTATDRSDDLDQPVPAGSYLHPAEKHGYMDAVDPDAYPPTPGQGTWQE